MPPIGFSTVKNLNIKGFEFNQMPSRLLLSGSIWAALLSGYYFIWSLASSQAVAIDTRLQAHSRISPFGEFGVGTYGQTVTVPLNETILESFSFTLDHSLNLVTFAAYVGAWDGGKLTGPLLFSSEASQAGETGNAEQFTFATGALQLEAGSQYVLFVSASNFFDGAQDVSSIMISDFDSYPGGNLVALQNESDFGLLTRQGWTVFPYDAGFTANFASSVPEPNKAFFGISLFCAACLSRRFRR